ncbi:MAG: imidazoleglycerol-phosphate dehydratase HisB [Lachnospirales bacterium]
MRKFSTERVTKETEIKCEINIDGMGKSNIATGIGFFDHMLEQISKHGFFDLDINAKGDTHIDCHHTIEDTAIVLGTAILQALGDMKSIRRYGYIVLPMEEALVLCSIDICGRPYLNFQCPFTREKIGDLDTEMIEEFFRALAINSKMTIHIKLLDGKNNHHICEGIFKAFAKALDEATSIDPRIDGVLSTKGVI